MTPAMGTQAVSSGNPTRDAALATLVSTQSGSQTAQGDDATWANCPPSGSGDEAWPTGANWHWDGHTWWHWNGHQWARDASHNANCGNAVGSRSAANSNAGSGSVTTTAYDAITGLTLVLGGVTGIFTESKTGTAAPYQPSVTETLALAAVNLNGTCTDPGPPAPTSSPTTLPATVCEIVEYTNDANPVVVDGPAGNDVLNGTLDFLAVSALTLTAGNTYTFYLVYPNTIVTTPSPSPTPTPTPLPTSTPSCNSGDGGDGGGDGGHHHGDGGGGYDNSQSSARHGSDGQDNDSFWDGSSEWGWNGSQWCHNPTPPPSCSPDHHRGDGGGDGGDGGDSGHGGDGGH
jgi:hypothetical protein